MKARALSFFGGESRVFRNPTKSKVPNHGECRLGTRGKRARLLPLPTPLDHLKQRAFWIVARSCLKLYGALPLFGPLRAALGVIHREGKFLVIQRNDGRGVSLPGGLCNWREAETLEREVREETGMTVSGKKLVLRFYDEVDIPCNIALFELQASGELKGSWEGTPRWMKLEQIEGQMLKSQRPALEVFRRIAGQKQTP